MAFMLSHVRHALLADMALHSHCQSARMHANLCLWS